MNVKHLILRGTLEVVTSMLEEGVGGAAAPTFLLLYDVKIEAFDSNRK